MVKQHLQYYIWWHITPVPVNCKNGKDSIPSHIRMPVFEASPNCRHQWLQKFWLLKFTQKTQCWSTQELIGMLQILVVNIDWDYYANYIISFLNKNSWQLWKSGNVLAGQEEERKCKTACTQIRPEVLVLHENVKS